MDIFTMKTPTRIQLLVLFLISCVLCLISGHSRIVLAQEAEVRVEAGSDGEGETEFVGVADDIVVIDPEIIYIDDSLREQYADEIENEANKESDQSGDRFPPEVRKMMDEEGISPEDLMKDPGLREEFRKKVEKKMKEERGEDSQSGEESGKENNEPPKPFPAILSLSDHNVTLTLSVITFPSESNTATETNPTLSHDM